MSLSTMVDEVRGAACRGGRETTIVVSRGDYGATVSVGGHAVVGNRITVALLRAMASAIEDEIAAKRRRSKG